MTLACLGFTVRDSDGLIAMDLFTFVDGQPLTNGIEQGTGLERGLSGGKQPAFWVIWGFRTGHRNSKTAGAWAGAVLRTGVDRVFVLASEEKYLKAKALLKEVHELLEADVLQLSRKQLEQIRGLLMYVTCRQVGMPPYMINFHMTIDSWRWGRDAAGWRSNDEVYWLEAEDGGEWGGAPANGMMPATMKAIPSFRDNVEALLASTESDESPLQRVRCQKSARPIMGLGAGFRATLQIGESIYYEYGQ
jgi:hypothetical protein